MSSTYLDLVLEKTFVKGKAFENATYHLELNPKRGEGSTTVPTVVDPSPF